MENTIHKQIMEKAVELCNQCDIDILIYGDAYVEFTDRGIQLMDQTKLVVINKSKSIELERKSTSEEGRFTTLQPRTTSKIGAQEKSPWLKKETSWLDLDFNIKALLEEDEE